MNKEPWADRFEAEKAVRGVRLENKGIFIEGNGNELPGDVPLQGRGHAANVYLFAENSFDEHAAEFRGAINGSFTCVGMELVGAFDIYRAHRALIFERWDVDELRRRANGKGQVRTGCATARPPGSPPPSRGRRRRPRDGGGVAVRATVPQMEGQGWAWQWAERPRAWGPLRRAGGEPPVVLPLVS